MSDLLNIGLSGLRAYRSALAVVGDNVANAETPGYARRTISLTPGVTASANSGLQYLPENKVGGVSVQGVQRSWDMFRAAEVRRAESDSARADVRQTWLTRIENSLGNETNGVGARLTAFFNAADTLAATPDDTLGRRQFLMALEDVAAKVNSTAEALDRVSVGVGTSANLEVTDLNTKLEALAQNNKQIRLAAEGSVARANLQDERDKLVDSISQSLGVVATVNADGTTKLATADAPATTLVDGTTTPASFSVAQGTDGRLTLTLTTTGGPATSSPASGRLSGLIDAADKVATRKEEVIDIATDFAADLNAWSAAGQDANGNAGPALLAMTGGKLTTLVTDPAQVPAATPSGAANGNLLALSALRGSTGSERRWNELVAGNAQDLNAANSQAEAATSALAGARGALDEITGIDLDREAADLLRYQQAYSASAKIIQVGKDTFNSILGIF